MPRDNETGLKESMKEPEGYLGPHLFLNKSQPDGWDF